MARLGEGSKTMGDSEVWKHWTLVFGLLQPKVVKNRRRPVRPGGFWRFGFRFISRVDDGSSTESTPNWPARRVSLCRELAKKGQIVAHVPAHGGNPVLCIAIAGSAPWVAQAAGHSVEPVRCEVADLTFPRLHW